MKTKFLLAILLALYPTPSLAIDLIERYSQEEIIIYQYKGNKLLNTKHIFLKEEEPIYSLDFPSNSNSNSNLNSDLDLEPNSDLEFYEFIN